MVVDTKVYMNLGIPDLIERYAHLPFDGIGLMRIEFVIASRVTTHPLHLIQLGQQQLYIDELSNAIARVASAVAPRPVVVRFSDFKTSEYRNLKGGAQYERLEKNPMLGWRGASRFISEEFNSVFRLECQAIRSAAKECSYVWAMLPFIRTVWEAKECLAIMQEEDLGRSAGFKIWLMAEVPSVALAIDDFNQLSIDGYSIGSNDLTQFVLAVDRDSSVLAHKGYFSEKDPAVMKAMEMIISGAKRAGKTCSICGEGVSNDIEILKAVLHLGIDSISVEPDAVMRTKEIVHQFFDRRSP